MSQARTLATLTLALLMGTSLGARAEDYPKQIEMATQGGGKVVQTFQAASQLKGWVLSKGGRYTLVFTTPDGKTLIVGELIDDSGKNLTAEYARQYLPKPDLAALFPELEHSANLVEGARKSPKSVIYVFFDPNCPFCHLTWKALQPYEKAGLQVRWVPVAYLMQTSPGKAAAILEAKDRTAAFRQNEEKYNEERHEGGIDPLSKPSANTVRQLQANNELMQKFGAFGTPALVWKDSQGKIQMKSGLPRLSELPAITGLPEQAETDPGLAKFR
jgi:thiol:disulfide interchange protein DsbG